MQVLNIFHVLVAIAMCAFILVQRGPGATAGAAFGSGASGTVFGSRGAGSFLSRSTWVLATLFCLISLVMAVLVSRDLSTPETDLGVVGNAAPVAETIPEPTLEPEVSAPVLEDPDTDLPVLETDAAAPEAGDLAPETGDLPAADTVEDSEPAAVEGGDEGTDG